MLANNLFHIYFTDIEHLLALLGIIKSLYTTKRIVKKVRRFELSIGKCYGNKEIYLYKLNYFINFLTRKLKHRNVTIRIIKVKSLFTEVQTDCCPEVYICTSQSSDLFNSLPDSGAKANLILVTC